MPRYFSLPEARAALREVRPLMAEVRRRKLLFDQLTLELEALTQRVGGNGHGEEARKLAEHRMALQELGRAMAADVARVQELGAEVKDLDQGLVDFRSRRDGREVYLCWRVGEEDLAFWHDLETGFAGRQPL